MANVTSNFNSLATLQTGYATLSASLEGALGEAAIYGTAAWDFANTYDPQTVFVQNATRFYALLTNGDTADLSGSGFLTSTWSVSSMNYVFDSSHSVQLFGAVTVFPNSALDPTGSLSRVDYHGPSMQVVLDGFDNVSLDHDGFITKATAIALSGGIEIGRIVYEGMIVPFVTGANGTYQASFSGTITKATYVYGSQNYVISNVSWDINALPDTDDVLVGLAWAQAGADQVSGGGAADLLYGFASNDTLTGGTGADTMVGGTGSDRYNADNSSDVVTENFGEGDDIVAASANYTLGANVERLEFTGSSNLTGTGNALPNSLTGNAGANTLNGLGGNDSLNGGGSNDRLNGDADNDRLFYTAGLDTLDGGTGGDTADFSVFGAAVSVNLGYAGYEVTTRDQPHLDSGTWRTIADLVSVEHVTGSAFADRITGNTSNNLLSGGAGNDRVSYSGGLDTLDGGTGNDTADFSAFGAAVSVNLGYAGYEASTRDNAGLDTGTWRTIADLISIEHVTGSAFADRLTGNASNNLLSGGAGNDRVSYTAGLDTLDGGTGNDTADFSAFGAAVSVNLGYAGYEASTRDNAGLDTGTWRTIADLVNVEHLTGSAFADRLTGNTGGNILEGGAGHDSLAGSDGADTLIGGAGNDTLTGGLGADRFDFTSALSASTNVDRISDYNLTDDLIRLDNDVFTAFVTENVGLAAGAFWNGAGITAAHDADDRIIYNNTTGNLYYDPDGTGAAGATLFATLTGSPGINAGDFFVVA